jgi:pimeloyl-ACP methyl ester carboxylesterase
MAAESAARTETAGTLHGASKLRHLVTLSIGGTLGFGFFLGSPERCRQVALASCSSTSSPGSSSSASWPASRNFPCRGQTAGGFAIYAPKRQGSLAGGLHDWVELLVGGLVCLLRAGRSPVPGGDGGNGNSRKGP